MSIRRSDTRKAAVARSNTTRKPKTLQDVKQGIRTLYEPAGSDVPEVDIVFVPGLGADPINSWRSNINDFNWTSDKDGIVRDFPKSRVLLYLYESAWTGPLKVKQYLGNLASTLLHGLKINREKCPRRPIVFIGHSMGGLVIAKAITLADARRDQFPAMFETIAGCVFFGTPFGGALAAAAASFFALVGEKFDKANSSKLLDLMKPEDEGLRELKNDFMRLVGKLSQKIELFCFYEEQPTNFAQLAGLPSWIKTPKEIAKFVTRESATLSGNSEMGLACIHRDLVKFDGPKDERYQLVRSPLKTIIHGAQLVVKNRLNSTRNINHETITDVMEVLEGAQIQKKRKALGGKYAASSWLTKEQEYRDWLSTASPDYDITSPISPNSPADANAKGVDCLWIEGPEGRGKTNNMIAAIDEIEKMIMADLESPSGQAPTLLAYFFFEPTPDYSTAEDLLKSLLWQLVKQQGVLAPYAKHFVKKKAKEDASKSTPQLTVENMWQVLQDMLSDEFIGSRVYFVINNLHVLPEESDSTTKLMNLINSELMNINLPNQKRVPVRWLFTSRDKYVVREALKAPGVRLIDLEDEKYESQVQLELRKHAYLEVRKLSEEKKYNKAAAYFTSSLIGRRAQNTQWIDIACIHLKEIPENENELTVRHILEDMPQDLASLLERAWLQIFSSNIPDVERIHEMLRALVLTFEDPTEPELGVLTGLYPKEEEKKAGEKKDEEKSKLRQLVERCKPLLVVKRTGGSGTEVKICFMNVVVKSHLLANAEKLLGLSKEATAWQHGVLSLRSFSHLMERLNYPEPEPEPEPEPAEGKEGDDDDDADDASEDASEASDDDDGDDSDDDVEDLSEDDSEWDSDSEDEEMDPEKEKVRDVALAYMVKHWLHHASKATAEIAEDLSLEEEFWKPKSLIRRRWLIEYARLNPSAFEDIDLDRNLSALHVAASVGFSQLVVALIKHGHQDELSLRDTNDDTPLHLAAYFGRVNIVEELLNRGAVIDDGKEDGNDTPLHNAALQGNVTIMRKLINRGADINACVPDDIGSVVNAAIYSGNREAIKLLIEKGASLTMVASEDEDYDAPLSLAAQLSDLSMFEYLIDSCADKLPPEEYDKALVAAAEAGRVEVFSKLLSYTHPQECFQKALDAATEEDNWDIIMVLLERYQGQALDYGALFEEASGTSENQDRVLQAVWKHANGEMLPDTLDKALIKAAGCGKHSTVEMLLRDFGANPDAADEECGTALTEVAYNGDLDLVKLLLDRKADVNASDGWALQTAAAEGHKEIVEELLEWNADVNACTANENFSAGTALQAACEAGKVDIVELLLEHKADPNLGPGPDTCPLIAATERGEDKIVELLIKAHANVNVFGGDDGSTPLIKAALYLPKESVELLSKAGAEINTPDNEGDTALIAAAYRGDQDSVEYLLGEGADIMHSNNEGLNAIQTAVKYANEECLPPLVNHASAILSAIKTAMESGNSVITDVIRSVKFVKQEGDSRRGSDASFVANDDAVLLASSVHESEDKANDDDQLIKKIETDEPSSMGLNSLFARPSELDAAVVPERDDTPLPTELAGLGVDNWFQEPSSNFTTNQSSQQWTPQIDTPSTPQMKIRRKPSPATSNSGQPPLALSPARSDYAGSPYQQEAPNPPLKQLNAPSLPPRTPLGQSTASYSSQSPTPQYQTWSPDQNTYNQTTPPLPNRTQYQSAPPEVQPAPLRPYAPYNPQSYPAEQYPMPTPPWSGGPSPQNQSQGQDQGTYFVGNPYDGDGYGGGVGGSGTRPEMKGQKSFFNIKFGKRSN